VSKQGTFGSNEGRIVGIGNTFGSRVLLDQKRALLDQNHFPVIPLIEAAIFANAIFLSVTLSKIDCENTWFMIIASPSLLIYTLFRLPSASC